MIILLNGPPGSGKDTAGRFIEKFLRDGYHYKMSRPLKRACQSIYGYNDQVFRLLEESKDEKTPFLHGLSYREAQIAIFKGLEVAHNQLILADIAIGSLTSPPVHRHYVITDCGMSVEAQYLVDHFGKKQVGLIKLEREGCDFSNDIREYVDCSCNCQATIKNEHDLEMFEVQVKRVLKLWGLIDEDN